MIFFNPDRFQKPVRIDQEIVKKLCSTALSTVEQKFVCIYATILKYPLLVWSYRRETIQCVLWSRYAKT